MISDWIEVNSSPPGPNFYKKILQRRHETQDKNTFKMFVVPIRNFKNVEEVEFQIDAPMLKYFQSTSNGCFFSSLTSAFDSNDQIKSANAISNRI